MISSVARRRDSLPIDQAGLIDSLCDAFETAWKRGEQPEIHGYLEAISEGPARTMLLEELLALEFELQLGEGKLPDFDAAVARFPDHETLVRQLIQEAGKLAPALAFEATAELSSAATGGPSTLLSGVETMAPPRIPEAREHNAEDIELATGQWVGPYQIIKKIGVGGMGVVYRAWQKPANRIVALKLIRPRWGAEGGGTELIDERAEVLFLREAQAAANMRHNNIVRIFDVGRADGRYYYSMEHIEGKSLAGVLEREGKPLSPRRAAAYLKAVADAIAHAHAQGIVHRDLKPGNILIDESDQPIVVDFGLAKLLAAEPEDRESGQRRGTLAYMPPEQVRGETGVGITSDIYSLGATLYELLTGRPPFQAALAPVLVKQVLDEEPRSPRARNPAVPRDLETICLTCLRKKPEQRYQSAAELAAELHRFLEYQPIRRRRVWFGERLLKHARRQPVLTAALALTALAMAAVAWNQWQDHTEHHAATRQIIGRIVAAPMDEVPALLAMLEPHRDWVDGELATALRREPVPTEVQVKLALALWPSDPRWRSFLVRRLPEAPIDEHRLVRRVLGAGGQARLIAELARPIVLDTEQPDERRLRAACALIGLDDGSALPDGTAEPAWALLRHSPDDSFRDELIEWLDQTATDPAILFRRLRSEPDASIRRAVIQALGTPDSNRRRAGIDAERLAELQTIYRNDPDSGIHGGIAALLRSWELNSELTKIDATLVSSPIPGRDWFVNPLGQTFMILPGRPDDDGDGPRAAIPSFAMAATETTRGQYTAVLPRLTRDGPRIGCTGQFEPGIEGDVALVCVSFYDAMRYCRRLSELEGISEEEMCYPPLDQITPALAPPLDAPQKHGWRLPTYSEWEYACRGDVLGTRFFGRDDALARRYAWCDLPTTSPPQRVGRLRPNEFGLADILGNAAEWIAFSPRQFADLKHILVHPPESCICGPLVGIRGGGMSVQPKDLSSGSYSSDYSGRHPSYSYFNVGFRIVRTLE